MSKERILETIGQVKDEFVEEAVPKGLLNDGKNGMKCRINNSSYLTTTFRKDTSI